MRKFADSKANQKTNERAIKSAVNGDMRGLLDWWYKFIAKYPQYSHATDNQLPDQELLNEIQSVAMESDIRQRQIATNSELIAYAALVYATKTGIELNKQLNAYFKKVAKSTVNKIKSLYPKASKGDIQALVDGVIADVNWSDRIWSNMDELQYDVSRIMKQALLTHTNPVDAVAEIRKRYNVLDYQARRLLRTESARIMAEESIRASKEAGYSKLRWVANTSACRICAPLDGHVFSYREADGMIPRHPNCLCSWVGVDEQRELIKLPKQEVELNNQMMIKIIKDLVNEVNDSYPLNIKFDAYQTQNYHDLTIKIRRGKDAEKEYHSHFETGQILTVSI